MEGNSLCMCVPVCKREVCMCVSMVCMWYVSVCVCYVGVLGPEECRWSDDSCKEWVVAAPDSKARQSN